MGPFKCYVTQWRWGGVSFPGKKHYGGVQFNVISVMMGWVGVKFPGKKRYITLEWPQCGDWPLVRGIGIKVNSFTVRISVRPNKCFRGKKPQNECKSRVFSGSRTTRRQPERGQLRSFTARD